MRTLRLPLRKRLVAFGLTAFRNAQGDGHRLHERNALWFRHGVQLGGQRLAYLHSRFAFAV
ncbi:hypothetical protein [Pseudomonas syringae]|uniref:hypothetical protein n=1 Tax=Pseudomonas syringae TaxID=317 RepID=UPI00035523CC|nr:hypothetical protein [Pseudomonas syringae]EPM90664.1 hypothetical protein A260_00030 [Pseudomonas syringae pv. actinidiae ICMP 19068]EPM94169.1 hypothetical protein A258_21943 [Pseudomonas syringae pv. actinidiae ICMP 19104]EPN08671.1 hypothetical protein A252_21725 [Pseudomonas syringae pv. actinidiae ICMP 9855]MDU8491998.1 hypothetical protein [Pseudomonas syringae pv. actinidiae]